MKVRYSPLATQDLAAIHQYLTERNPSASLSVLTTIYAAIEFIRRNPQAAEPTSITDVRAKVVQRYRFKIFYRVAGEDIVEILHIRHTSREPWAS